MSLRNHSNDAKFSEPVTDVMASRSGAVAIDDAAPPERYVIEREPNPPYATRSTTPSGLGMCATMALLLSAWAAVVPFLGATFGFSADGQSSWTWSRVHVLGALVPGVIGVLASVLIIGSFRHRTDGEAPRGIGFWSLLLVLVGAWFVMVPVLWPVLVGPYFHVASPSVTLRYWLGYASGPGLLITAIGAFMVGCSRHGRTEA
jgi:hypothetical protein